LTWVEFQDLIEGYLDRKDRSEERWAWMICCIINAMPTFSKRRRKQIKIETLLGRKVGQRRKQKDALRRIEEDKAYLDALQKRWGLPDRIELGADGDESR
jgi:hypothetical protein